MSYELIPYKLKFVMYETPEFECQLIDFWHDMLTSGGGGYHDKKTSSIIFFGFNGFMIVLIAILVCIIVRLLLWLTGCCNPGSKEGNRDGCPDLVCPKVRQRCRKLNCDLLMLAF
ncbi:hypothetical protein KR026_007715 [Drosophila bipectinata]|nr:hypothetical protein KR026_007715 [Drosophila bipectinata]